MQPFALKIGPRSKQRDHEKISDRFNRPPVRRTLPISSNFKEAEMGFETYFRCYFLRDQKRCPVEDAPQRPPAMADRILVLPAVDQ